MLSNIWTYSTAVILSASQLHVVSSHNGNIVISSLYKNYFHLTAGQQLNVAFHIPIFQFDTGYSGEAFQYANFIPYLEGT